MNYLKLINLFNVSEYIDDIPGSARRFFNLRRYIDYMVTRTVHTLIMKRACV